MLKLTILRLYRVVGIILITSGLLLANFPFITNQALAATALTAYLTSSAATTTLSSTANQLTNTAPASETSVTTKVGKTTGYCELFSRGTTTTCTGAGSAPAPSGNGFVWDVTTLEGQQIVAGNWTGVLKLASSKSGITGTASMRAYKYSGGTYTLIATSTATSKALSTTASALTFSAGAGSATTFATGDKLYVDVLIDITANTANSTTLTVSLYQNGGTSESMATPGYQSAQPPTVTTQAGTTIAATTATGNGTITSIGGATVSAWGVCYKTVSGCTIADSTVAGSGTGGTGAFTASITGLSANTTYYLNAYATNTFGTSYGSEVTILTLPNAPGTPTFTTIKDTTLTVNWTAPIGGASSYNIERCTGSGCSNFVQIASGVTGTTYNDSGLTGGTIYQYRIRATNATGDGTYSGTGTVTTGIVSISITSSGVVSYGYIVPGASKDTTQLADTQTVKNDGTIAEDISIKGQNSANWTLAATAGTNQYVHQFCLLSCTTPPTNYAALTTNYQTLVSNIAANNSQNFDLRIVTPTASSVLTQQSVNVTVLVTAH